MAIITYPLNGVTYDAGDAETYLCTRTSGVFASDGMFEADLTGDRKITIGKGLAWIKNDEFAGKSVAVKEPVALTIPAADGALPRIDRIVLRFNAAAGKSELMVLKGTPASSPAAPAVSRTALVHDLGLYTVNVPAGSLAVSAADISSTMADENVCGLMRDGVTGIPTAQLQEQANELIDQLRQAITSAAGGAIPDGAVTTAKFAAGAEAPLSGNGTHALSHAKSGTYHLLTGLSGRTGILSAAFRASAAFTAGDTVKVDGEGYTALMQDGSAPETGLFPAGGAVGCIIDTEAKTVNFKGGGGVKLPALTNPAAAAQITKGFQAFNALGEIMTGSNTAEYVLQTGSITIDEDESGTVTLSRTPAYIVVTADGHSGASFYYGPGWNHSMGLTSDDAVCTLSGKKITITNNWLGDDQKFTYYAFGKV